MIPLFQNPKNLIKLNIGLLTIFVLMGLFLLSRKNINLTPTTLKSTNNSTYSQQQGQNPSATGTVTSSNSANSKSSATNNSQPTTPPPNPERDSLLKAMSAH